MQHFIPFTPFYACFLNNANLPPNLFSGYYFQNKHSVQVCVCVATGAVERNHSTAKDTSCSVLMEYGTTSHSQEVDKSRMCSAYDGGLQSSPQRKAQFGLSTYIS